MARIEATHVTSSIRRVAAHVQATALAVIVSALAFTLSDAGAATDTAASFVQKSASEAIAILSNKATPEAGRREQFRAAILKNFDVATIGRAAVEPYWAAATPDQQSRFQAIFQGALANIYTERFFDYDGESLQVKATHPDPTGATVVQTTIATPTGNKAYDVDWIVTGAAGKEKFLDVVIDGVSTSATTQQDYASVLRSSNGNLDALTAALTAKGY